MSGFIDPNEPTDRRIERLEVLVAALVRQLGADRLQGVEVLSAASLDAETEGIRRRMEARLLSSLGYPPEGGEGR